jgi:hypothetical protein
VAVTRVPVVAGDVADLDGLREVGERLATGARPEATATGAGHLRSAR